jgi:hypothetical protein
MSSRSLTTALRNAVAASQSIPVLFVELDFSSGFLRLTSAGHDLVWNGFTWTGVGMLGTVESIKESTGVVAHGLKLTLSGVDNAIISIALQQDYQGRAARLWFGAIDISSGAVVADPVLLSVWRMDTMTPTDGADAAVVLTCESEMAAWSRPRGRRYTDADQRARHPTDGAFRFVTETATRTISWGKN